MAKLSIRIMHNGKPLEGAEVTAADCLHGTTDKKGVVSKEVSDTWGPCAAPVFVEHKYGNMGTTAKLVRDVETVLEV